MMTTLVTVTTHDNCESVNRVFVYLSSVKVTLSPQTEADSVLSVVTDKTLSPKTLSDPGKSPVYLLY